LPNEPIFPRKEQNWPTGPFYQRAARIQPKVPSASKLDEKERRIRNFHFEPFEILQRRCVPKMDALNEFLGFLIEGVFYRRVFLSFSGSVSMQASMVWFVG